MRQLVRHYAVIITVTSIVLLTNLGGPRLWDRDEPRNAGCAAEMLARGDWVTPVFNGELRSHKPVLLYWFMMTAYSVFGVGEFAARFWSAVLAMGTVLMTYGIGRRLFNAQVALWSALVLSTSIMFDVAARAATPDSVLIFFSTAALLVYVLGTFRAREPDASAETAPRPRQFNHLFPPSWIVAGAMYAMMGVAVLGKGPVGMVLPTAVIGMFLLIVRLPLGAQDAVTGAGSVWWSRVRYVLRPLAPLHFLRTCWFMRPLLAVTVALLIALPWYVWVGFRTEGEWLRGFFLEHNLGRATRAMEGHNGSFLYYPVAILVGFFPWSIFMAPLLIGAVRRVRRDDPWQVGYLFALCWMGVYVGLFSLARTKLPSYVTPCYPALALLTGCFIYHWTRGTALSWQHWPRISFACLATAGIAMLVAIPLVAHRFLPGEETVALLGLIPLGGAMLCAVLSERGLRRPASFVFAVTAVAFMTGLFAFATVRVDRHQQIHVLLDAIKQHSPHPRIGAYGCLEPSWVFYAGRTIDELEVMEASAQSALPRDSVEPSRQPAAPPVYRPKRDAREFLDGGADHFVITTRARLPQLGPLPAGVEVLAEAPYFLKNHRLVVLGRSPDTAHHIADRNAESPPDARR